MSTGTAIHIGLNGVDPAAYEGWDGTLDACENDATSMEQLTSSVGFSTQLLLTADATVNAVFGAIAEAASYASAGDICVITYAGHGGQFEDLGGEEQDEKDETWLLYDREVLDDEIHAALAAFARDVRVVVLSDSCHSGTVVRNFYREVIDRLPAVRSAYERVAPRLRSRSRVKTRARELRLRGAPPDVQNRILNTHRALYEGIRAATPRSNQVDLDASVILISGCQDNQESAEQNGHGAFTAALLEEWNERGFRDDYPALHSAILAALPATQSPNYYTDGVSWPEFEAQVPFTIEAPGYSGTTDEEPEQPDEPEEPPYDDGRDGPRIEGPRDPVSRADSAPSFTVYTGANPYYIFEIASDPNLFDGERADERSDANWYSSWDDPYAPVRLQGELYWLPDTAWESLRDNDQLWFRVGTTPSEDSWDGYTVSTADDEGESAPSITIVSAEERRRAWRTAMAAAAE
jgi:metacaspase-1